MSKGLNQIIVVSLLLFPQCARWDSYLVRVNEYSALPCCLTVTTIGFKFRAGDVVVTGSYLGCSSTPWYRALLRAEALC